MLSSDLQQFLLAILVLLKEFQIKILQSNVNGPFPFQITASPV